MIYKLSVDKYKELINSNSTFMITTYAEWSNKCRRLSRNIKRYLYNYDIYRIDVDDDNFTDTIELTTLPCVWIYKKGEKIELANPSIDDIYNAIVR